MKKYYYFLTIFTWIISSLSAEMVPIEISSRALNHTVWIPQDAQDDSKKVVFDQNYATFTMDGNVKVYELSRPNDREFHIKSNENFSFQGMFFMENHLLLFKTNQSYTWKQVNSELLAKKEQPTKTAPKEIQATNHSLIIPLGSGWDHEVNKKQVGVHEWITVLGSVSASKENKLHEKFTLFEGVTYLMPVKEAIQTLQAGASSFKFKSQSSVLPAKTGGISERIAGWPQKTFKFQIYDIESSLGFNSIALILTTDDRVVGIELIDESPKNHSSDVNYSDDLKIYSFGTCLIKGSSNVEVGYNVNSSQNLLEIDSALQKKDGKLLHRSKFYLAEPVAQLIKYIVTERISPN